MNDGPAAARPARLRDALTLVVVAVGLAVLLVGWGLGIDAVTRVAPGLPAMVPTTALCFVLIGGGLFLATRGRATAARVAAGTTVVLVAGVGLSELAGRMAADRMSLSTILSFLLSAVALFGTTVPGSAGRRLLVASTCCGTIALIALTGYVFSAEALVELLPFRGMAVHTAALFLLVSAAILLDQPERTWVRYVLGSGRGSRAARRLFPVVIVLPFLMTFATLVATDHGLLDADLRLGLLATVLTALAIGAVLRNAAVENAAEQRGIDSEVRLRALVDGLYTSIMAFDRSGALRFSNASADRLVAETGGGRAERWLAESVFLDPETFRPLPPDSVDFRRPWDVPVVGTRLIGLAVPDGGQRILHLSGGEWRESKGHRNVLLMLRDVTDEFYAVRGRQAAERLNVLGEIAGGIAHDVANLLGVIRLSADVGALQASDPEARAEFDAIRAACDRGAELTSRVLTFARSREPALEAADLAEILPNVVALARRTLPSGLTIDLPDLSGPLTVEADGGLLESAVLNLLVNARDAIVESGQGGRVSVSVVADGDEVVIEVADDGPGMAPYVLRRANEPFFTTREATGGTGLGLATVARCAEVAGGRFQLSSTEGAGTVARLTLRAADAPLPQKAAAPSGRDALAGRRVLVVEDDPAYRRSLVDLLTSHGADVRSVADGEAALAALEAARPDLVLTDLQLPGRADGLDVVRRARQRYPGLPTLLLSGVAGARPVLDGTPLQALKKPIGADTLLAEIVGALGPD
ncbi:hybrid sensor histidine kinase/response regulator [Wenxinia marina]|uniref:histidine kinase n=1 Tax=Wenxinia marina DSM 24838 TaxID=1123501 RepID=A0A0D0QCY4_9RHOB|nr:ATP-binding protein [Wenxinia marina]KIQ68863.1 Response regulator receiver domain protein/Histidine kinase-, DNA gyrase B-, and HSP90-like ATPase [Wenxinia marina DSM 24838]GGL64618.1 hypothetical protein GCM10011392_19090 [Wenxinia marina]